MDASARHDLIARIVRETLGDHVVAVDARADTDFYGDPVDRVTVRHGAPGGLLDPEDTILVRRHVIDALLGRGDETFPIFYFAPRDGLGRRPEPR